MLSIAVATTDEHELFEPDAVMPEQWFEPKVPESGEQRLHRAIFVDAMQVLAKGAENRQACDAIRWFESDEDYPFSFVQVCDITGLSPVFWRRAARVVFERGLRVARITRRLGNSATMRISAPSRRSRDEEG